MNTAAEKFAEKFSSPVFEFIADGSFGVSTWSIPSPTDLKTVMKNAAGWYGGQWEFNGAKCILHERRGEDRGTAILYGQNLIDLSEDADNSNVYTHIMPYFVRDDDTIMGSIDNCVPTGADTNGYFKVMPLDLTREFDEEPTQAELNEKAQEYIAESSVGNIVINRNVSFINRGQTVEYRLIGDLDRIDLGDTVTVKVPPLGIEVSAVCKKTVYESYLGRYESVEIGDLKKDIVKTIAELSGQDRKYPSLFVKDTEPTKEDKIKNGDYWIKVNDMVNRIAQSLGKYRGGKWQLLCDMPEGGDYMPHVFVQPEEPIKDLTTFISVGDYWIETDSDENAKALYKYVQDPADADNGLWDKLCSINGDRQAKVFVQPSEPVAASSDDTAEYSEGDCWVIIGDDNLCTLFIYKGSGDWEKHDNIKCADGGISVTSEDEYVVMTGGGLARYVFAPVNGNLTAPIAMYGSSPAVYTRSSPPGGDTDALYDGDYWAKIDNNTDKILVSIYRYDEENSEWELLYNSGDGEKYTAGSGIYISEDNEIRARLGTGLSFNNGLIYNSRAAGNGLLLQNNTVSVKLGEGLAFDENGAITVTVTPQVIIQHALYMKED